MATITGYTPSGQAYYTSPNGITQYLGAAYDRAPTAAAPRPPAAAPVAPSPSSNIGLLTQAGNPTIAQPKPTAQPATNAAQPTNAAVPAAPVYTASTGGNVTKDQWANLTPTGAPGNTFAGNLFNQVMANNGLSSTVYNATHNDPGTFVVGGGYGQTPEEIKAYAGKIQPYYDVTAAPRTANTPVAGTLYDQLQKQGTDNKFNWTTLENGNYDAYNVSQMLAGQGISSLDQLGFGADGSLINKATGKPLTTREKDQLGMSAAGTGRVDYDITKGANGEPVIKPVWKSSTTDLGVAGTLLPIAASFLPGFGPFAAAALAGGMSIAEGGETWDALKSAGLAYAGSELTAAGKDFALNYAAEKGWSLPDFSASGSGSSFGNYDLGTSQLGTPSTGNGFFDSVGLGNSTGSGGGTGSGLSLNPGTWGGVGNSLVTSPYLPSDYTLNSGTNPINNNGSGLSTKPTDPFVIGGSNNGLSATPGTGTNLFQPTGSGGLLGTGGTSTPGLINSLQNMSIGPNSTYAGKLLAGLIGGAAGGAGAGTGSGGSGYADDGYRPTISQTGWSPTATPTLGGPSGIGLITIPKKGQANDGLWRYGLLG